MQCYHEQWRTFQIKKRYVAHSVTAIYVVHRGSQNYNVIYPDCAYSGLM